MVSHYDAVLVVIPLLSGGGYLFGQLTQFPLAVAGLLASLLVIGHELFNPPTEGVRRVVGRSPTTFTDEE